LKDEASESSLIGVVEVKLLLLGSCPDPVAPAGHSLLFAVGAEPPLDGVRRARRLNLFHESYAGVWVTGAIRRRG
jgi:hypothetical protein